MRYKQLSIQTFFPANLLLFLVMSSVLLQGVGAENSKEKEESSSGFSGKLVIGGFVGLLILNSIMAPNRPPAPISTDDSTLPGLLTNILHDASIRVNEVSIGFNIQTFNRAKSVITNPLHYAAKVWNKVTPTSFKISGVENLVACSGDYLELMTKLCSDTEKLLPNRSYVLNSVRTSAKAFSPSQFSVVSTKNQRMAVALTTLVDRRSPNPTPLHDVLIHISTLYAKELYTSLNIGDYPRRSIMVQRLSHVYKQLNILANDPDPLIRNKITQAKFDIQQSFVFLLSFKESLFYNFSTRSHEMIDKIAKNDIELAENVYTKSKNIGRQTNFQTALREATTDTISFFAGVGKDLVFEGAQFAYKGTCTTVKLALQRFNLLNQQGPR